MRKVLFVSLGCDKNLVDSEYMLGLLADGGYELTDDESQADIIIINTCSFIHDARDESVQNILEMAEYKKSGSCRALIVTGCLAQSYGKEILDELDEVDAVLGTNSYGRLPEAIDMVYKGERPVIKEKLTGFPDISKKRVLTTGGHYEYLKIAEGCQKGCSYCAIPKFRGGYRSVPMDELVKEAEELAEKGVVELIIVAQETTVYGIDLYGEKMLHVLLEKLCEIDKIHWIRLLYCYPEEIYPKLIETISAQPKICNYLDMPIQHCNDEILSLMRRRTRKGELLDIVGTLRESIPGVVLRTSLISGFPTESDSQHKELVDFVREVKFNRLGVFAYSREDGTPAAAMDGQINEDVKAARVDEIMSLQQVISKANNRTMIGQELEVFVEGFLPEDDIYIGRTYADAPAIDGYIFFESKDSLESGMFVNCRVVDASEYDLYGEII